VKPEEKTFFATDEQAMNWFVKRLYSLFKGFGPVGIDGPDFDLLTNQEIKIRVIRPQFQKDLLTYGLTWEDLYTLAILFLNLYSYLWLAIGILGRCLKICLRIYNANWHFSNFEYVHSSKKRTVSLTHFS